MDYRMVSVCYKKIHFPRFFETVAAASGAAPVVEWIAIYLDLFFSKLLHISTQIDEKICAFAHCISPDAARCNGFYGILIAIFPGI